VRRRQKRIRVIRFAIVALVALAVLLGFSSQWLVARIYPLQYKESLFREAQTNGLDPYLIAAVVRSESHFDAAATSSEGARGLMQIMPDTGEWAAAQMKVPFTANMLYDPDYNLRIGCWYLAHLQQEFGGDPVLALAAYNGGRGNVTKWLSDRQWTGEHQTLEQIPFPETRLYVAKVLRDVGRYRFIYGAGAHVRKESLYAGTGLP
jgi:soluble lytic murein transglycosylase